MEMKLKKKLIKLYTTELIDEKEFEEENNIYNEKISAYEEEKNKLIMSRNKDEIDDKMQIIKKSFKKDFEFFQGIPAQLVDVILDKIKESKRKTILIINKIDLVKREKLLNLIDIYSKEYKFEAVIPISATNIKYKEVILEEIEKNLKPGPAYYDIEEYTDQTMRQLAEETIREKALKLLDQEVPHGIYVEVEKMQSRKNKQNEDIYDIEATIYCLRNSHKGIIIGKNGDMLKRIGRSARIDMERNFGVKVNLKTWVKVKEDWQENDSIVNKFKLK